MLMTTVIATMLVDGCFVFFKCGLGVVSAFVFSALLNEIMMRGDKLTAVFDEAM